MCMVHPDLLREYVMSSRHSSQKCRALLSNLSIKAWQLLLSKLLSTNKGSPSPENRLQQALPNNRAPGAENM
jgi:hypothetical protein